MAQPLLFRRRLAPGERLYGLGDKTSPLDRRGHAFVLWNTDPGNFASGTDPLYKAIPLLFGVRAVAVWGSASTRRRDSSSTVAATSCVSSGLVEAHQKATRQTYSARDRFPAVRKTGGSRSGSRDLKKRRDRAMPAAKLQSRSQRREELSHAAKASASASRTVRRESSKRSGSAPVSGQSALRASLPGRRQVVVTIDQIARVDPGQKQLSLVADVELDELFPR